jgi:hypothetical protein
VSGDATRALVAVIDEALGRLPVSPTREAVLEVRARLLSPLRVAVAGSVSSGKSTLVNALLGQRIAPVDAGECTRIVTWFRYDHHQRIEVQRRDGSVTTVPFGPGNRIPDDLGGVPADDVARLIVHLSNERLRDLTIIDTPGLNTVTDENQRATADALGLGEATQEAGDSRVAMSDADALLFLTPHVRESDVEVLEQFRALFAASGLSAANAVGILSKVDRLAPDGDPWPVARRLTDAAKDRLANVVSDVVPVMGLMAETASTDAFTEGDAFALAALAKLDELDLEDALLSPQDLLDADVPDVSRDQLRRLLTMLDLHGIAVGVELVQGGARGAGELLRGFRQRSGLEPLADVVEHDFARRASALKARGGLADLRRILGQAQGEEAAIAVAMAGPLERVELDPELHDLRILDALRAVEEGAARVPDDLRDALKMLALEETPARRLGLDESADPGEIAAAASRAVAAWARYSNDSRRTPDERRLGEDVREWYELVWDSTGVRPPRAATGPIAPARPASDPAAYAQPGYDPAYGQPAQPAYDPAAYGQAQPTYDPAAYGQQTAAPAYDPAAYGQQGYDPAYGQAPAAQPAYDASAYGHPGQDPNAQGPQPAAPGYDPSAYGQPSAAPGYGPATQPPAAGPQGYAASPATQPPVSPAYGQQGYDPNAYAQQGYAASPATQPPVSPAYGQQGYDPNAYAQQGSVPPGATPPPASPAYQQGYVAPPGATPPPPPGAPAGQPGYDPAAYGQQPGYGPNAYAPQGYDPNGYPQGYVAPPGATPPPPPGAPAGQPGYAPPGPHVGPPPPRTAPPPSAPVAESDPDPAPAPKPRPREDPDDDGPLTSTPWRTRR